LQRADIERQWLFDRCKEVEGEPDGYLDLWSREHYKSTIITYAKTFQDILASHGDDPIIGKELTFGIFSHTRPVAKSFLKQIKRDAESNEFLRELFPDVIWAEPHREASSWSDDGGLIFKRKSNPKEATLEAWGVVDGQPTGKHFDVLVYDDVVTQGSVGTPEMIQKTTDALALSYNLGAKGGTRRFIGTRYHFNDSYRTIIGRGTVKARIHAATEDGTLEGKPNLLSKEELLRKRADMGPYIFACQMMLDPKGDETQGFKREWIRYHDGVDHKQGNVYLLFDPANEKKKTSDYTSGWAVLLGKDKKVYVLNMLRDRLNLTQRADQLFEWHRAYDPKETRYEKYGMQADLDHFEDRMRREVYRFDLKAVAGKTPKNDRIKRLIPYFEQGRILLPKTLYRTQYDGRTVDLVNAFVEEEYMGFPVPVHDDMLDSLARLFEPDLDLIWPKAAPVNDGYRSKGNGGKPLDPYDF